MSIIVENINTGETRELRPGEVFRAPWKVKGTPKIIAKKEAADKQLVLLDKISKFCGLSTAHFIKIAALVLKIPPCASCQLRFRILSEIHKIGWLKAATMIKKSINAQWNEDIEEIKLLEIELNDNIKT